MHLRMIIILLTGLYINVMASDSEISKCITQQKYKEENIGLFVVDCSSDSIVASLNADKAFNPASLIKLLTASAAYDLLGINYKFRTNVYKDGLFNRTSGTISGNLYIKGFGDPGFVAEQLWVFVQHLSHLGIRRIEKNLLLDETFFDTKYEGPGWEEDMSSDPYEAPVGALSANFNTIAVFLSPGDQVGKPVYYTLFPKSKGVEVLSSATTTDSGKPDVLKVSMQRKNKETILRITGNIGKDIPGYYVFRKIYSPSESFGYMITELLRDAGISIGGTVQYDTVPDSLVEGKPFYSFVSRPISESVNAMFKYSSNFTSEMVLKTISAEKKSPPGSWENGCKIVQEWWRDSVKNARIKQYCDSTIPVIRNGSGLGGGNSASCHQLATLLRYVWEKKTYTPEFISNLSIAGVDGTVARRFKNSPLKGILRAKTGTLNDYGVSNIAGYILDPKKTFIFVICIRDKSHTLMQHWQLQQSIIEAVYSNQLSAQGKTATLPTNR